MIKVHECLKEVLRDALQRVNTNSMPLARVKGNSALSLSNEVDELEKIVVDKVARLRRAVAESEALVAGRLNMPSRSSRVSAQTSLGLRLSLRETENTIRRKDSASQKTEESFTAEIHALQNDVKNKERTLVARDHEIDDLRSKLDVQIKQVKQLNLSVDQAKAEAERNAKNAEQVIEIANKKIAALEAKIGDQRRSLA